MAAMPEAYDLACVVHVHSTHSDGTGTVAQIAKAAARAGADVVLLTDHDTLAAREAGEEGWHGDVLVLVGEEITPVDQDHYLAFGIERTVSRRLPPAEACAAVRAAGGFGFAAHPFAPGSEPFKRGGYPYTALDCEALHGIELWSIVGDTGSQFRKRRDLLRFLAAPNRFVRHPPEVNMREWDRLCAARRTVAVGGLDAHQIGIRIAGRVPLRLMGYHRTFRILRTHVLAPERTPAAVYDALREGRCYLARDGLADATGFTFSADGIPMGAETDAGTLTLRAGTPRSARIRLLRDGREIAAADGTDLAHTVSGPGVFRVEAWLGGRLWIASNPVYARPYTG